MWHSVIFEPLPMARLMRQLLDATGRCTTMMNATLTDVQTSQRRITAVRVNGQRITADLFIDATGNATLASAAGTAVRRGQESRDAFNEPSAPDRPTSSVNAMTLIYRVTPAPANELAPTLAPPTNLPERCHWQQEFPVASIVHYPCGDLNINMLPTMDGATFLAMEHDSAMAECRRRVHAHWLNLQRTFDAFRRYRLIWIASMPGLRETQRIVARATLTENDIRTGLANQTDTDLIAVADHALDTHGRGGRCSELAEPYGIPYRCLLPIDLDNLLVVGRCAGFSALAASSCRLSRTMIQLGQAGGTAAALASAHRCALADVPADTLRAALKQQGVQLNPARR
jgi:hypothetical protein